MNKTELKLEDYCQSCEAIEPEAVEYPAKLCWSQELNDFYHEPRKIVIMCKKRALCARLYQHLKSSMEETMEK